MGTITIPKPTRLKKVIILILSINITLGEQVPNNVPIEQVFLLTILIVIFHDSFKQHLDKSTI